MKIVPKLFDLSLKRVCLMNEKRYYMCKYVGNIPKTVYNKLWSKWFLEWLEYMCDDECKGLDVGYYNDIDNFNRLFMNEDKDMIRYFIHSVVNVCNVYDRLIRSDFIDNYFRNVHCIFNIYVHTPDGALCLNCFSKINVNRSNIGLRKYVKKWRYRYYELSLDSLSNLITNSVSFCNSCFICLLRFFETYEYENFFHLYPTSFSDMEWKDSDYDSEDLW